MVTLDFHVHLTGTQLSVGIAAVASITTHILVGFPSIPSCSSGFVTTGLRLLVKGERGRRHEASCHRGEKRIRFKRSWARTTICLSETKCPDCSAAPKLETFFGQISNSRTEIMKHPPFLLPVKFPSWLGMCLLWKPFGKSLRFFFFF